MPTDTDTLYALADREMRELIPVYLGLTRASSGFSNVTEPMLRDAQSRLILLSGIGSPLDPSTVSSVEAFAEWERTRALPFDVESAITRGVYLKLRDKVGGLVAELDKETKGFLDFDPAYITAHPYLLPVLQRLAGASSKSILKSKIGSASDNAISAPAADRLVRILKDRQPGRAISRDQLLQSIEPTLEGIVRDLVGRVLLESIVASALTVAAVPYRRESEYKTLRGVVYDFRADFVIPDETNTRAFIEVRKSSSRHASLYAKDKLFSAINWKGANKDLLAILIVDGPWTSQTLKVLAKVFDYVMPISRAAETAAVVSEYLSGDTSKLKWLVQFSVLPTSKPAK